MGYNSVAVIYNDFVGYENRSIKQIDDAIKQYPRDGYFNFGQIVSMDHSSYDQVVIVGKNTGSHISKIDNISPEAITQMKTCLEKFGYKVSKKRVLHVIPAF